MPKYLNANSARILTTDRHLFAYKGDELAKRLMGKVLEFQDYAMRTGKALAWQKNRDYYENRYFTSHEGIDILDVGEQGELEALAFNHFRNILRHTLNPVISMNPSFTVTAINNDIESRRGADIGKNVIDYYEKTKRYSKISKRVAELGVVYGVGFQVEEWNPLLGKQYTDKTTGKFRREGDFDVGDISPWDCFYDFTKREKPKWFIFRRRKNKYDIASAFGGEKKRRIESLQPFYFSDRYFRDLDYAGLGETDDIYIYSAYAVDSPALRGGRYCLFCGDTDSVISLYEDENLYGDDLPIFPMMPGRYIENYFGFTDANILRAPQEFLNDVISKLETNSQSALKDIYIPTGSNITIEELSSGRNLIQADQKPEPVDLYAGDGGLLALAEYCKTTMETLSAQNAVIRGDVASAPNLKSGIAIQTVIAMGQQFAHGLEAAYQELFEDVNTFRLKTLQKTADSERIINIVGRGQAQNVVKFTKEDIKNISKVVVEPVNPILNSPAGRIEVANDLLEKQLPGFGLMEFFDVVHTGNLSNATELQRTSVDYAAQVYDMLLEGQQITPVMGADHIYIIKKLLPLQLQASLRQDQEGVDLFQRVSDFITQTMDLMRNGDEVSALVYQNQPPTPVQAPLESDALGQINEEIGRPLPGGTGEAPLEAIPGGLQ